MLLLVIAAIIKDVIAAIIHASVAAAVAVVLGGGVVVLATPGKVFILKPGVRGEGPLSSAWLGPPVSCRKKLVQPLGALWGPQSLD